MWATDFQIRFYFSGPAPRLSERRALIFGLLACPSFPHWYADFYGLFGGAAIFALSCFKVQTSKQLFRANCILFIRLRTNIKAGIFPFKFSIFFRETTFLESNAGGGGMSGGSHRAGLVVSKKEKRGRKKEKENSQSVRAKNNYVNPSIPKDKTFDEYHFTKWVLSDERFQKGNGR